LIVKLKLNLLISSNFSGSFFFILTSCIMTSLIFRGYRCKILNLYIQILHYFNVGLFCFYNIICFEHLEMSLFIESENNFIMSCVIWDIWNVLNIKNVRFLLSIPLFTIFIFIKCDSFLCLNFYLHIRFFRNTTTISSFLLNSTCSILPANANASPSICTIIAKT